VIFLWAQLGGNEGDLHAVQMPEIDGANGWIPLEMIARVIDGRAVAATLRAEITARVVSLSYRPSLVVILVGDDPASVIYVQSKDKAALQVGIDVRTLRVPRQISQAALLNQIEGLNADMSVDAILVQFPLPPQINPIIIVEALDPAKDVDGFHPLNVGRLASGRPGLAPCTPLGVMRLLAHSNVRVAGAKAIVVGRSTLVGRPLAALLLAADATVTIAHSSTQNLANECRRADILIAAAGRAEMVRGDWIKPRATIIDVGVNRLANGRLVGDVAFNECVAVAQAISPVPGGVGPMTIACLLENTVLLSEQRRLGRPVSPFT
jgi:methylenetetrahydrofolate dehydrogenase (NADP+)/methenyltetrahydrofolate cyclohydrolase